MLHRQARNRTVVGIVGNIVSFLLFASPAPTYYRIYKNKSTEEFHPYPYLATVINCLCWIFYGLPIVHPDSTLVITINGVGLAMELVYLAIFFYYTNPSKRQYRWHIILVLLGEIVLVAIIAAVTLLCFDTHKKRSMVVGIICDIFGIIMYASPCSILLKVYKTKSAEFLPIFLCLVGFANGALWFAYAFLKSFDPYIATGNGIGGLFGLYQISVWVYYAWVYKRMKHAAHEDAVKPPAELQNVV